jgi:hypothetical protein
MNTYDFFQQFYLVKRFQGDHIDEVFADVILKVERQLKLHKRPLLLELNYLGS